MGTAHGSCRHGAWVSRRHFSVGNFFKEKYGPYFFTKVSRGKHTPFIQVNSKNRQIQKGILVYRVCSKHTCRLVKHSILVISIALTAFPLQHECLLTSLKSASFASSFVIGFSQANSLSGGAGAERKISFSVHMYYVV